MVISNGIICLDSNSTMILFYIMPSDLFQVEQAKFEMEFAFMNVK